MTKNSPYTMVRATYQGKTLNAFWFEFKKPGDGVLKISVPRSLIHGADERDLSHCMIGASVHFRLMEWKVRELGI